jgi:predicted DNA-binding transcriptional regulator AlpA
MSPATITPYALRRPDVLAFAGISDATLQRLIARDEFPKPRRLSAHGRAVVWLRTDVEAYLAALPISDVLPPPVGAGK